MVDYEDVLAPNTYFDRNFNLDAAKILPGEFYVTGRDMVLVTVLGSCVSACIRDPINGVGGMNHFMLPDNKDVDSIVSMSARYGVYAMELLINQLIKLGGNRKYFEVKVFGGGSVLRGFSAQNNVGERNARFVLDFLQREGFYVASQDLLDVYPRKVYFFPLTGKVLVKKLKTIHNSTIIEREVDYKERIENAEVEGEVELFKNL